MPFAVAMTADTDGVTGSWSVGDAAPGLPAAEDTVFRIFSMTKAIGATAAAILIDRGRLTIDTPVADVLPEWNELRVLDGFDGDDPILRPPRATATIRHLATHTSGLEYDIWNADVRSWLHATGHPPIFTGKKAALRCALTSDPGTRWGYGLGVDWLGQVVESVDGRTIGEFCRSEIFEPLGMHDTTFEPGAPDRLAVVSMRTPDGGLVPFDLAPPTNPEFHGMGHALYSTAPDYLRFCRMVLDRGSLDGNRILSADAATVLTDDQMRGLAFEPMTSRSPISADVDLFPGTRVTHTFAFLRNEEDIPDRRRAGSLGWAGICNTHYWIDPASDVAAVLMTQSLPFAERRFLQTYEAFERAVYAAAT